MDTYPQVEAHLMMSQKKKKPTNGAKFIDLISERLRRSLSIRIGMWLIKMIAVILFFMGLILFLVCRT